MEDSTGYKPHYRTLDDERLSADQMDEQRKRNIAYEYLCHLEEAKIWIQACINEDLPPTTELEEGLRNGVFLAKLGHFFAQSVVPIKRIYDKDQTRYHAKGLHFRHTDNINHWLRAMAEVGLPKIFYPETTDIYDKKNMPRAVYCVHALSLYLFKLGLAPQIQDLYGKINFTEEEISAMRKELDKYGIQMPAFSKIGGILANEMTVDDAALHAAIIAINEAIDQKVAADTFAALQNPAAALVNLQGVAIEEYQDMLFSAKQIKAENARNKMEHRKNAAVNLQSPSAVLIGSHEMSQISCGSINMTGVRLSLRRLSSIDPDRTYDHDVYDELLTQAEIQGNVNRVNTSHALKQVNDALLKVDFELLLAALRSSYLGLKNITDENVEYYSVKLNEAREIKKNNNNGEEVVLDKEELQQVINQANLEASAEYKKAQAVKSVNEAIDRGDHALLLRALQDPSAQLSQVYEFAGPLYQEELVNIKAEKQNDLDYEEIAAALTVLNAVAAINKAVDAGDSQTTFNCLCHPDAHLPEVDEHITDSYQNALAICKLAKDQQVNPLLTHSDIVVTIEAVHQKVQEEHERIQAIEAINEAINKGDENETLAALQLPAAKLSNIQPAQALHYQILLARAKDSKAETTKDEAAVLWLEEIQAAVDKGNSNAEEGLALSRGVQAINEALEKEDAEALISSLLSTAAIHNIKSECGETYLQKLTELRTEKARAGETGSGWMMNRVRDGSKFYYNTKTQEYTWARREDIVKDFSILTKEEVQGVVSEVTAEHNRQMLFKANEQGIILGQARVRGYLARKKYQDRKAYLAEQTPAVTRLQASWRGYKQRQAYKDRLSYLRDNANAVLKLQSYVRMWRAKKRYNERKQFFKEHEDSIVKIQAFFRSNLARQDYRALMYDENPSLAVVRKFVHLLDASDNDYAEELELQKLRQQVVAEIRSNQQLEQDLDQMDIKIGLLIKNRITLQDVVTHNRKLTKRTDEASALKGLKALSKESHERLETYQHLFYLLQTNPTYLAKLIFEMPQSKTTKFMEAVIFSLFNYGANQREEYLLLKLFRTALEEEIQSKVDKMTDIVTGNPLVVKMIVAYNRNQRGQNALREMLNPLITTVIEDRGLRINTNPVEVYKAWVNQMESSTGKTSELPYDVSTEQALEHPEVREKIDESIQQLQALTDQFLNKILASLESIPYGMRYMARVMREALVKKFPDAPEKEVLKIVGNLLYYRYINSAIVAPDAFDIVNVGVEKALSPDQRRNLGSIAKILQFAASNKGFGGESAYLAGMNDYIRQAHEKFKKYCLAACDVEEPEVKFNIDRYSDVVTITKPVIYVSVKEIVDTHSLLLQHQERIASDHDDPLHELLEDLGDVPTIDELLGTELTRDEATNEALRAQLSKTEISLTLSSKFEMHATDDKADLKSLLIRTKRMIVDVVVCQPGDKLTDILDKPSTSTQEERHQAMVKKRDLLDKKLTQHEKSAKIVRHASITADTRLPLETMKTKIRSNLQTLELAGMVTRKDHYQDLINSIVQDIRNQRRYRNSRKQELLRLRNTFNSLNEKRAFYESQIDYYNQYVKTCLENLQDKSKKPKRGGLFKRGQEKQNTRKTVTYNAAQLHERGVILEIESLPQNQFKNTLFEIATTEDPGVFEVNAKFMGVNMDKVELVFQDLLQLQYEGVAVMKMFNRAKVNVNLLIFLLNRKFYGKHLAK
ncbi:ras GTPase-activating-like protein IQGAP1 isoform X2 [Pomacea canaliculata]|uniref:ras GTPase-activating-like protein IQGAP1 isoform X2 n=1 Tax=Pomacea canaliculata TaxID=400727 RepID=UPI000D73D7A2|nr:ras GTPase-activating-like protein IQGAP1 isoform X2 [Pomacea canaliculata]